MYDHEGPDQKAIRILKQRLEELHTIRGLDAMDPAFTAWQDSTREALERFLGPESRHAITFKNTSFLTLGILADALNGVARPPGFVSPEDEWEFEKGCAQAEATLKAALKHIEDYGVRSEDIRPAPSGKSRVRTGGVSQTLHGPVTIQHQAIATDKAIQNIGSMGDQTVGTSLKEIAGLLRQSEDLTPRQLKEGLADIEAIAVEEQKPEPKRNWEVLLERGSAILGLIDKATDLGHKLAMHTAAIVDLVEQAKHYIK
ncbi:MAG TPA: hypothetical protein VGS27_31995 [Candidatus Sulfotelmatobacter sp.]|nr:hypothetical protein [Candidatus Sulfotelmatobacter sp.]